MSETFNAKDLRLRPEQLKPLRPVETGTVKVERRRRVFAQITSDQFDRLSRTKRAASWKVFLRLLFLTRYYPGRTTRLANDVLEQIGVSRREKSRAISELEELGLIEKRKRTGKSPEIIVQDL